MLSNYTPRTRAGFHTSLRALALSPAFVLLGIAAPAFFAPVSAAPAPVHARKSLIPLHKAYQKPCAGPSDVTLDFVAADINDVLKALSMQTHVNIVSGADVKGTVTVSLAHVSLEDALDLVTRLSGYQYAKIGRTYVVGSPATIATLTAEGRASEPVQTAVVPYLYSSAEDVTGIIKQLIPGIQITPGKTTGGQGGVLIVTGTETQLTQVRQVVAQSEAALSRNIASSETVVYKIRYANAGDLQSVLGRLAPGVIITPGPTQGFDLQAPTTADAGGVASSTTSFGGAIASNGGVVTASNAASVSNTLATKSTTTSLLLTGSVADIAKAQQILTQIDTRPVQIRYEARVTEVSLTNANELGLTYDFTGAHTTIGELLQPGETTASTTFTDPFPGHILKGRTFGRTPLDQLVTAQLHAAFASQNAKLLASPNISALDGQPAATFVGDTISYISAVTQGTTGTNITTSTVNAGIKLFVTGKVNNDGYITMNIHPEVSLVTLSLPAAGGVQVPDIRIREATTTVRVRDGETIAISGLINDQDTKDIQKVPILGDIPFFGQLFRDTKRTHTRDEVIIFIRVSIQKDPA